MLRALILTVLMFTGLGAGALSLANGAQAKTPVTVTIVTPMGGGCVDHAGPAAHGGWSIFGAGHPSDAECQVDGKQSCPVQCGVIYAARYPLAEEAAAVGDAVVNGTGDDVSAAGILRPPISRT